MISGPIVQETTSPQWQTSDKTTIPGYVINSVEEKGKNKNGSISAESVGISIHTIINYQYTIHNSMINYSNLGYFQKGAKHIFEKVKLFSKLLDWKG